MFRFCSPLGTEQEVNDLRTAAAGSVDLFGGIQFFVPELGPLPTACGKGFGARIGGVEIKRSKSDMRFCRVPWMRVMMHRGDMDVNLDTLTLGIRHAIRWKVERCQVKAPVGLRMNHRSWR